MKASMYYWKLRDCNSYAEKDDTSGVTEQVKGSDKDEEVKPRKALKDKALKTLKN